MSANREAGAGNQSAQSAPEPVEVTINIRSQPPFTQPQPTRPSDMANGSGSPPATSPQNCPSPVVEPSQSTPIDDEDPSAGSPPVLAIDDDEDDAVGETMDDYSEQAFIQIANEEETPEEYYRRFPYAEHRTYTETLRMLSTHVQTSQAVEGRLLPDVAEWLEGLPSRPISWPGFYVDYAYFWDEFSIFVNKLLSRRLPLGDSISDYGVPEEIIFRFLRIYVKLCARLMQIDAEYLSRWTSEVLYDRPLLCYKHLRLLFMIFRLEKPALFNLVPTDPQTMTVLLVQEFIKPPTNGHIHLFNFAESSFAKINRPARDFVPQITCQLLEVVGGTIHDSLLVDSFLDRPQFCRSALRIFRTYNDELQVPGRFVDVNVNKDLLLLCSRLLFALACWDTELALTLANEFLEFSDPESPATTPDEAQIMGRRESFRHEMQYLPGLISNAYKFKTLKKYVLKGRMELRVISIGTMDTLLVEIWRELNVSSRGIQHPVMQYLADFLLHEKVVDYIISVDSHPQLISRSGNIVGFLVVTHRYSESQTDAIWNTVANSPDPRVVSATIAMLRGIVGLMDVPEVQYLCTKLYDLPIESYTIEILRFCREFSHKIQLGSKEGYMVNPKSRPANVCVRVIKDTSPSRSSTKLTNSLFHEASEQLRLLAPNIGVNERHRIYESCVQDIAAKTSKATGSIHVVHMLWMSAYLEDMPFLTAELALTHHLVQELCVFVESEKKTGPQQFQSLALQYRLDLLGYILACVPDKMPLTLCEELWDHLVGQHALNNVMRDVAWTKFAESAKHKPQNPFVRRIVAEHIPHLEPVHFTPGLYEFVAQVTMPHSKQTITSDDGTERLEISGADLLWPLVLTAPAGTIEDVAARLLASRYIEVARLRGVRIEEVEEAHGALVEQCTHRLLSSYNIIRGKDDGTSDNGDSMVIISSDSALQEHELRFTRTLLFEKLFLQIVRTKPEFNRDRQSKSKSDVSEVPLIRGDAVEIKFQAFGGPTSEKQSIIMGTENTLQDLYDRFCQLTGFTDLHIIAQGRRLKMDEEAQKELTEFGWGEHIFMLVKKAPGADIVQPDNEGGKNLSVFEATVLKHFEDLYACMDSDDHISEAMFDFLNCFRPPNRIADAVASKSASSDEIFPPGKVFQAQYAAIALHAKLRAQLSKGIVDETFLANAIQLLDKAILNDALVSSAVSGPHDIQLASVLVLVLLAFLKERPLQNISGQYFSNESKLVDRLLTIMTVSLTAERDSSKLVCDCYSTILEASLHSKGVWDAFFGRGDVVSLHKTLLLTDRRFPLRAGIARSIASICGGDLPSTAPLSAEDIAAQYWGVISSILPEAVHYPAQAAQLFNIAEQVFRQNDENKRDETSLLGSLRTWTTLLLRYKHKEFVGRDEVDHVIMGFTKLLLCCIPSLKSFKKPLNGGAILEKIFSKFLFVPRSETRIVTEETSRDIGLPVLESQTRKELYDLMLSLAEDRKNYDIILDLVETLVPEDESSSSRAYQVERVNEIRSSTGYVGLVNPRAICYMNSLLTQLFMNLNFRKFMLEVNVADANGSQRLISETQKLFAMMQNTFRKAADPRDFAACVKGLNSEPIDINIQMDADEFYNLLFDQWEGQMLSQDAKQRFRSFYGGQTVNQIKSKECDHVSERVESYFVVQCDVQGKANLQESLQAFVEGDVMEGDNKYKCESCGGKFVDAVKRTCLKDVPDNLIFHLKRFDFDLMEMRRTKINDHFEFPSCIDISAYKIDHLSDPSKPRQEDLFELVGVLIHQGTSENGHYYSFIRERPCASGSSTSWLEFNDREVNEFDPSNIAYQAYGGFHEEQFQRHQKQYSAYMLFYQRKSAIDTDRQKFICSPDSGPAKVPLAPVLDDDISIDNDIFLREYCLYDPNHSKFVRQMLTTLRTVNHGACSEDHQQEGRTIRIVLEHIYQVVCRMREMVYFDEIMTYLRKTLLTCPSCCYLGLKWVADHDFALNALLLRCPHAIVRATVRDLIIDSLRFLRGKSPSAYGGEQFDPEMEGNVIVPSDGILVEVVRRLRQVCEHSWFGTRGWDDLHSTLCQVANMGSFETAAILDNKILEFCLAILCMHVDTKSRRIYQDIHRVTEKKKHIYNGMIELVYTLLAKMDLQMDPVPDLDERVEYTQSTSRFPLTYEENRLLHTWDENNKAYAVLDRMIEHFVVPNAAAFFPGEILKLLLQIDHRRVQSYLFTSVSDGISGLTSPFSDPYVRAAISYCEACPTSRDTIAMIDQVTKSAAQLRENGGEVHLEFFSSLLLIENEAVFSETDNADFFYHQALSKTRDWAGALLMYEDESVRNSAAGLLQQTLLTARPDETASEDSIRFKYQVIRRLIQSLTRKIRSEHEAGTMRSYMQPMIQTCEALADCLYMLVQSTDPEMAVYKSVGDMNIMQSYHIDVVARVRNWVVDDDPILSSAEAYEASEYASESDDGADLES